jgi:DNA polymerase delta subunit 1
MSMEDAFKRGVEAAAGATALFPGGKVKLEFEKVYKPYWIFMKKRYAALKYEGHPSLPPKMDVKGIAVVRRDNCALVRQVISAVLVSVLQRNDLPGALGVVREALSRVQRSQVAVADLCITKALRAPDKYVDQHHEQRVGVKKMTARREFGVPRTGDRVKYVITSSPEPRICDRADDPRHVQRHGLPLDRMYYLNNQLMKPVLALFASLPPQLAELTAMFEGARAHVQRELDGIGSLAGLCPGAAPLAVRPPPKRKGRATLIPAGAVTSSLSFLMAPPAAEAEEDAAPPPKKRA